MRVIRIQIYVLIGLLNFRLCIVSNEINGLGLCNLADALRKTNITLTEIYVWGNNLEESCCIVSEYKIVVLVGTVCELRVVRD